MSSLDIDTDLFSNGIKAWADRVRKRELSFAETVEHCLARAEKESTLNAFECLDIGRAQSLAAAMDSLLHNGHDLGPLMGLPIGAKDIMAVAGLPTTNGSNAKTAHITGSEGSVIKTLKAAGAIVLGKTKTVEFAFGATGINESRGTPWNPVDRETHRMPGGSSSGSAVAVAASLVGMALGTDTGGSVRIPASMTGIVGLKTTVGRWPTDGIFPLSPTLDSVGPLCRTVDDVAIMHTLMTGESVPHKSSLAGLRFGVPHSIFLDDLDDNVANDFEVACRALQNAGAIRIDFDFPEAVERAYLFPDIVAPEIISTLTPPFFNDIAAGMDTVSRQRSEHGLTVSAIDHLAAQKRRRHLSQKAHATFNEVDCWITPTCPFAAIAIADIESGKLHERALQASRNTQPGNLFGFCATALPMHKDGLPTSLQIQMPANTDKALLTNSIAVEAVLNQIQ